MKLNDGMLNRKPNPISFNHPDTYIAALRRELVRHPERRESIEAEIARADKRDRPAIVKVNNGGDVVVNTTDRYIAGLEAEITRHPDKAAEIRAEIKRVKARKDSVGQRGVERAVTDRRTKLESADS